MPQMLEYIAQQSDAATNEAFSCLGQIDSGSVDLAHTLSSNAPNDRFTALQEIKTNKAPAAALTKHAKTLLSVCIKFNRVF